MVIVIILGDLEREVLSLLADKCYPKDGQSYGGGYRLHLFVALPLPYGCHTAALPFFGGQPNGTTVSDDPPLFHLIL